MSKLDALPSFISDIPLKRSYKVVKIADDNGTIPSVKIRDSMKKAEERTLLIDANLLALLAVGATSIELIPKHKKTRAFTVGDYDAKLCIAAQKRGLRA